MIFDNIMKYIYIATKDDICDPPPYKKNSEPMIQTSEWVHNKERYERIELIQRIILDSHFGDGRSQFKETPSFYDGTKFCVKYNTNLWYYGTIKNGSGRPEGYGEITYKSIHGVIFCASYFRDGFFWYEGLITFENGETWMGHWERNIPL
ncbi:MAG: hypothetical protein RLZZ628_3763 [Bacteroidota bacterium]|jgi:hypothetical protein